MAIAKDFDRHVGVPQNLEVCSGVAHQFGGFGPEEHADLIPSQVEVPGDDKPVAGVVAFAAANGNASQTAKRLGLGEAAEDIRRAAAGVFHEHQPGHAVLLDRPPIDLAGLLSCDGVQCYLPHFPENR